VDKFHILKIVSYERDIDIQKYQSRDDCVFKIGFGLISGEKKEKNILTLSLLMYILGAPCKARNFNLVYILTYVW
jgi:hypothetical protein